MRAEVQTGEGVYEIDLDKQELLELREGEALDPAQPVSVPLPRVVRAAASGSTVVALVDAKPPLLVSHDAGRTWRESGRGLPPGFAVAIAADPDVVLYAARNRLYVSRDGGVFWYPLPLELPDIEAVALREA